MKHKTQIINRFTTTLIFSIIFIASTAAQTVEKKATLLLEKHQTAVVVITSKSVIKASYSGTSLPERQQKGRTLGVTVDDRGLIVASNSSIDASVGLVGQKAQVDGKIVTIDAATSEYSQVEISYGDNKTLLGKIVWQDLEADLIFIRPEKSDGITFQNIDLNDFAVLPNIADRVVGLSRTSSVFNYMPTLMMGRITGIANGDRAFFLNTAGTSVGMPIFTIDGKLLGITVNRIVNGQPTGILTTLSAASINVIANLAKDKN